MQQHQRGRAVRLSTGVSVCYVAHGDPAGTPVVLLHPWGESLGSFDRLIPLLPDSMYVVAFDQRGHGDAGKPPDGYALTDYVADLDAFLDELRLTSAVLVGSSSGGYVAQQFAVSRPRRVAGLVLVGAPRSLQGRPAFADEVDRLTDPVDTEWVRESLEWFPRYHDVPAWYLDERVQDGVRMPAHVWREALDGLVTAVPPTEAGTIAARTLVIWGGRDELLSREEQTALCDAIPESRLIVYDGVGHLVVWERPERVARDVTDFVEGLRPDRLRWQS